MRTTEIGACTPPKGTTPGMRRPVRTITRPPISSRRIRFGEPTSSALSGVTVAAFRPRPASRIAAAASCTTWLPVARRDSSERSKRGSSSSSPTTSGASTRSDSSSSSWPVWSPSSTTIVLSAISLLGLGPPPRGYTADSMARKGGWSRLGTRRFRYEDSRGRPITDAAALARIDSLRIPPAWKDVWISPRPGAKLQAIGIDAAGRRQYLYHSDYRARQEEEKYAKLLRFAARLPALRAAMAEHLELEPLDPDRVCALAARLIDVTWFRVGSERHVAYGVTTLTKRHVAVRGKTVAFSFRGKHNSHVRTAVVDAELAGAVRDFLSLRGGHRLFRYERDGQLVDLTSRRLNAYIQEHMGEEFTAKDFRTWGGTLTAAIALAEQAPVEGAAPQRRAVALAMRRVSERLGNTPAVCRMSYVSPAVIDQYLDGRTLEDFRPRHLRVVSAREIGLDLEEQALVSLLRSARIRASRKAA